MNYKPRPATQSDTDLMRTWMRLHGWPELPDWYLSPQALIVPGLAGVWLYTTNSGVSWLEHLVANPLADKTERREAIKAVINQGIEDLRTQGYKVILTMSNHPGALRAFQEAGFTKGDENMVQYLKLL